YNPTLDAALVRLAGIFPARGVGFILGALQGLNGILLYLLAVRVLPGEGWKKQLASLALAVAGMTGAGGLAQVGTTFYDAIISLGVLGSLLALVAGWDLWIRASLRRAFPLILLAGFPVGAAMGLKQPSVIYCIGLCLALLTLPVPFWRRLFLPFFFGLGILLGIAVFSGHWMVFLYERFGNPLFPYFNDLFQSPWAMAKDYRDTQFVPRDWLQRLFLPLYFALDTKKVGEIVFRDFRIPLLFVTLLAGGLCALLRRQRQGRTGFVLWAIGLSYGAWVLMFCIYRYAVSLEILAPLGIVLAIGLLPLSSRIKVWNSAALLLVLMAITVPGTWGRAPWSDRFVEVAVPDYTRPLKDKTMRVLMTGYQPSSWVIPSFSPEISFIRIQSNFTGPGEKNAFNDRIRAVLSRPVHYQYVLFVPWEEWAVAPALAAYGLAADRASCQDVNNNLGEILRFCKVTGKGPS
ncbi:MAG: hypothetical protein M3O22_07625, partial [Pseudomonadota bacterium]|nr:hypothetical protein [Pseudomonadota bacterium]